MSEKEKKDPFDGDYIGNIWGWKFSLWGLGLIIVLSGMMMYRHVVMGVPFGMEGKGAVDTTEQVEEQPQEARPDTLE